MLIYYSLFFSNNILKRVFYYLRPLKNMCWLDRCRLHALSLLVKFCFFDCFFFVFFYLGGGVIFLFCFALVFMTFISHILTGSYDFGSPYQYRNYNPFQYQYYGYPYDNYQLTLNPYDNDYDYRRPLFTRSFN